ncbi:MAG: DUF1579 family protein [Gemmatimonadaceae bacterium]
MTNLDLLTACAGSWRGTNTLQDPHAGKPEASPSTAMLTPVLGDRFVRFDYTWDYQGAPQEGSMLIGFEPEENTFNAHWVDSWHMGRKVMVCSGPTPSDSTLTVRGTYAAPPGPDWGWRIDITPDGGRALRMVMFNVWPDGREELAVEASYTRA